jgi:NTP pyrophosphatase (non-canonical NTP hydrolase)
MCLTTLPIKAVNILATTWNIRNMKLNDYQKDARATCLLSANNLNYLVTGLSAEAGEVAGKYAKYIRDCSTDIHDYTKLRGELIKELGDVLWFVAVMAENLDHSLEEVAQANIDKLYSRQQRGVLKGSGDER